MLDDAALHLKVETVKIAAIGIVNEFLLYDRV